MDRTLRSRIGRHERATRPGAIPAFRWLGTAPAKDPIADSGRGLPRGTERRSAFLTSTSLGRSKVGHATGPHRQLRPVERGAGTPRRPQRLSTTAPCLASRLPVTAGRIMPSFPSTRVARAHARLPVFVLRFHLDVDRCAIRSLHALSPPGFVGLCVSRS